MCKTENLAEQRQSLTAQTFPAIRQRAKPKTVVSTDTDVSMLTTSSNEEEGLKDEPVQ